ncbi:prenyltransferase/squalene oxidase repeat-containing protein [Gemmata massiliana]|uniref:prenyltransferase/squalene oxidase repeat-containing protein n=1 Tax=Gemmata massiliana TaxID=1210884 RepID=UPI0013A6ACFB|nr:prenyltransferase/squalene oxidase repeat-containing protein [Gemmata massiliana]
MAGGPLAALQVGAFAQPSSGLSSDTGAEFITPDTQAAIDRGLELLAQSQLANGSFEGRLRGSTAGVTGLSGLALLGAGNQPGRGKYGRNVSRVVDYVTGSLADTNSGFLGDNPFNRLASPQYATYGHGFASLFLAEVCGMLPDVQSQKKVRAVLEKATAFAVAAQNAEGGWRYEPNALPADVSVTVAMMMALRAARNAGVFVPKDVVRRGAKYIRDCQLTDGGFRYFRSIGLPESAFARSAAAVVGLYSASIPEDEKVNSAAIERGLRYLRQFVPNRQFSQHELSPAHYYYYGQYYAALAMWSAGGDYWRTWFPAIRDELLGRARANDGTWSGDQHGSAYATAMSLIVLQLPNNYLPILQK